MSNLKNLFTLNKTFLLILVVLLLSSFNSLYAGDKVSPMTIDGAQLVNSDQAKKLFEDGVLFIDVRKDSDWNSGRIPDAIHLNSKSDFSEANLLKEMKKTDAAVIYCNGEHCMRSSKACKKAIGWGFSNLYYYRDGFPAWKSAGHPVE